MSAAEPKAVVLALFEALNERRLDDWLDLLAPELPVNGNVISAETYRDFGRSLTTDDPTIRIEPVEVLADGDRVAVKLRSSGTHTAPFLGYAPTGRTYTTVGVYFFTVVDGRIVEADDVWDWLRQLVHLGVWPPEGHVL